MRRKLWAQKIKWEDTYQSIDAGGRDSMIHVFQILPSDSLAAYVIEKSCQWPVYIEPWVKAYLPPQLGEPCSARILASLKVDEQYTRIQEARQGPALGERGEDECEGIIGGPRYLEQGEWKATSVRFDRVSVWATVVII